MSPSTLRPAANSFVAVLRGCSKRKSKQIMRFCPSITEALQRSIDAVAKDYFGLRESRRLETPVLGNLRIQYVRSLAGVAPFR